MRRRSLAQDTGTDPFEDLSGAWDGFDDIAEEFSWASAPPSGSAHHVRRHPRRRTRR